MNYKHLSIEARSCIRKYYVEGLSCRKIAQLIGRSPSTVSREIRRNCTHMYDIPTNYPHTAQKKYLLRRSYCHRGMFRSQAAIEYINEKLKATWSPEQIACTPCGLKMPSRTRGVPPVMLPKPPPRQGQCVKSYEARCRSSSEWFPASSLVCFCITCQEIFLSARKPASAPCAAPAPCTARPPSRTRPQTRTKPHLCPPITGPNPNAPGRSAASDRNGPIRLGSGFPQSFHRLFHIFAGFPQWLSFPLAFFERDRVRSSEQCVLTAQ